MGQTIHVEHYNNEHLCLSVGTHDHLASVAIDQYTSVRQQCSVYAVTISPAIPVSVTYYTDDPISAGLTKPGPNPTWAGPRPAQTRPWPDLALPRPTLALPGLTLDRPGATLARPRPGPWTPLDHT